METRNGPGAARDGNAGSPWTRWIHRDAAGPPPWGLRRFLCLPWPLVAQGLLLLVGFGVQLVIIWAVGELVDVALGVMELWTELARKHLELTL